MVRARGLGHALGRVIGRALGRKDNRDSDEASQQRPTTFACRRHEDAPEDVRHVDHATNEVHEQPKEDAVDNEVVVAKGFPGGPHDTSILISYDDHVAVIVWNGEIFIFLNKLYFNKYLLLFLK